MSQNYSNIVAASEDGCYKKLYEEYRDLYREAVQRRWQQRRHESFNREDNKYLHK